VPIAEDGWLSERLGYPVFTVPTGAFMDPVVEELEEHGRAQTAAMYQAKLPTTSVEGVRALCAAGMYPVDVAVTLEAGPRSITAAPSDGVDVDRARPEHAERLLAISGESFRYSRFHLDPAIPGVVADRIKRDWIDSYLRGVRGEELLVGLVDGRPAGFLAVLEDRDSEPPARVIDLVAVSEELRGRGVARSLTSRVAADAAAQEQVIRVGTQAANVRATRMYEWLGFRVERTGYSLHMHMGRE
jgi:ribosomal protein S18 acetylase RimI-like enzyme